MVTQTGITIGTKQIQYSHFVLYEQPNYQFNLSGIQVIETIILHVVLYWSKTWVSHNKGRRQTQIL